MTFTSSPTSLHSQTPSPHLITQQNGQNMEKRKEGGGREGGREVLLRELYQLLGLGFWLQRLQTGPADRERTHPTCLVSRQSSPGLSTGAGGMFVLPTYTLLGLRLCMVIEDTLPAPNSPPHPHFLRL